MFRDVAIGSIEPGKYADIAVTDTNAHEVPPDELRDLECQMILFAGEVVYEKG